jgi:hypothetical protein
MRILSLLLGIQIFIAGILPGNNLSELIKVSDLVEHFYEHQSEGPEGIGFWAFLELHYLSSEHDQSEPHDHLPFHNTAAFNAVFFVANSLEISTPHPFERLSQTKISLFQVFQVLSFHGKIWQPPKI